MRYRPLARAAILAAALLLPTVLSHASSKRAVFMAVLPADAPADARPARLTALEGDMATMAMSNGGQFGFTPRLPKDEKTVVVTISDASASPASDLGTVEVTVGGPAVASKTTPSFKVQAYRVTGSD